MSRNGRVVQGLSHAIGVKQILRIFKGTYNAELNSINISPDGLLRKGSPARNPANIYMQGCAFPDSGDYPKLIGLE